MLSFEEACKLPLTVSPRKLHRSVSQHVTQKKTKVQIEKDEEDDRSGELEDDDNEVSYENRARAGRRNLNLNHAQYEHVTEERNLNVAFREIVANLFDQGGVLNGSYEYPNFDHIHFVQGERKAAGGRRVDDVIIMHNNDVRLAEIIHIREPTAKQGDFVFRARNIIG